MDPVLVSDVTAGAQLVALVLLAGLASVSFLVRSISRLFSAALGRS